LPSRSTAHINGTSANHAVHHHSKSGKARINSPAPRSASSAFCHLGKSLMFSRGATRRTERRFNHKDRKEKTQSSRSVFPLCPSCLLSVCFVIKGFCKSPLWQVIIGQNDKICQSSLAQSVTTCLSAGPISFKLTAICTKADTRQTILNEIRAYCPKPLKNKGVNVGKPDLLGPGSKGRTTEGTLGRCQAQWQTALGVGLAAGS